MPVAAKKLATIEGWIEEIDGDTIYATMQFGEHDHETWQIDKADLPDSQELVPGACIRFTVGFEVVQMPIWTKEDMAKIEAKALEFECLLQLT